MINDDDSGPILVQLFAAKDQSVVHLFDLERAEQVSDPFQSSISTKVSTAHT